MHVGPVLNLFLWVNKMSNLEKVVFGFIALLFVGAVRSYFIGTPMIVEAEAAESQAYYRMTCTNGPTIGMTKLKRYRHYDSGFRVTYMDGTSHYYSAGNVCIIDLTIHEEKE